MERSWRSRRRIRRLAIVLGVIVLLGALHKPILRGMGSFLIAEDPKTPSSALIVLGGNSFERGIEAAKLYEEGLADHIVCTGGNIPTVLSALDNEMYESEVTRIYLGNNNVPIDKITALTGSTSTKEESYEVREWCDANNVESITVISSSFHLRRVRMVFEQSFEDSNTEVYYRGASPQNYEVEEWWKAEGGLIFVFNEYAKYAYYLIKF
ncbi:MAG: YdcF family protein [Flavobacteriales bacterium]|nr:YdcF family protein [Flavobacteriales bacterium]